MARPKITSVRGVHDILPEETPRWQRVEGLAREIFARYGYSEIRIPAFERTELFARSIGEETDIVNKEMYTFDDKGGESLTLRPEAPASICRAYVQHALYNQPGVAKLFFIGPMFRYERPQAGRLRQFHQIDAEAFGSEDPAVDAEVIVMLADFLSAAGLKDLSLQINNLGDAESRPAYSRALQEFLRRETKGMGPEVEARVERNPMRFLDSKDPDHQAIIARAPTIDQFWNEACRKHLETVCGHLKGAGIRYEVNPRLVRGLDYYRLTVFEVTSANLGAQNAVCGGGRYDGLVEELGGPPAPAIGFAIGMERLLQLIGGAGEGSAPALDAFIVPLGERAAAEAFALAGELRRGGLRADLSFGGGSMKSQMRRADRSGAPYVLILGDQELDKGVVNLKHMKESRSEEVPRGEILPKLLADRR
ncbi:MAG: histidine--tRNA ligase [Candidatus Tectomicrobia bacterium]|uniref:Histidine--tRNA ligase n=1 Tax=Tectimicrobiota bacterium TaxID=2528274 RepID=A0A932I4Q6_UNCTE|nr:histidine--tRNA ligase [Candidatus Tectomicrobia bacterium]